MEKRFRKDQPKITEEEKIYYPDNPELRYKVGAKLRVVVTGLTHEGEGIVKVGGLTEDGVQLQNYPIFIAGALPKEIAVIQITNLRKNFGVAKLIEIRYHNLNDRQTPPCKVFESCGGCNIMHLNYAAQLKFKKQVVIDALERIGGIKNPQVEDVLGMDSPYHYRNKVQVPYHFVKGKTICGFYRKNSHEIVSLTDCFIQSELASDIAKFIKNLANELRITGYDEEKHSGILRHVMIRENKDQTEIMIVLVTKERKISELELLIAKITKRYPNVTSIIQNINSKPGNVVLGEENILLFGNNHIMDEILNVKFKIGPMSFYQVNTKQTEKLYQKVIEKACLKKEDILIDAYCGIGTMGLICANMVKKVYGVEIVEEAIANAKENATINDIKNVNFVCSDAEKQIEKWAKNVSANVIIVDPPRKGCEEAFLETIQAMQIEKIIYVSCNPSTLARDLRYLIEKGYEIQSVSPVDMFPNSSHVETVCLMSRI